MEISTFSAPTFNFPTNNNNNNKRPSYLSSSNSTLFSSARLNLNQTRSIKTTRRRGLVCNSLFGLGVPELAVIAGVAALVFGPKQLPEIGRTLGKSIKGFQQAAKEFENELKNPEEGESTDNLVQAKSASQSSPEKENTVASSSSKET